MMCDAEDDLKHFMQAEIKRQIVNGLGESAEIEVVEVEEIHQCTTASSPGSLPEEQHFMAKTKLMVTVVFPVTLRAGQGPPKECHQSSEDYAQVKGPECTGLVQDVSEPDCRALMVLENENEEVDVPESEFYDFECDRSEDKFSPGQVWASYDSGRDVMPRDYVQIHKVMSLCPFKVQIMLLEPRGHHEWVQAGNSITCGEFSRENRIRVMDQIDGFSHIMKWDKGPNDSICIYPAEREAWALYKDWKELNPSRRIKLGYDIVQVVAINKEDFTVSVVPLVKYKGSSTVFHQQKVEPFQIHKRDFVRFSHQIATYEILEMEGCIELDPGATPH